MADPAPPTPPPAPPVPNRMRRYCGWWLAAILGLAVTVAALTLAVDPYGLFGTPTMDGVNRFKPATVERADMAKSYMLPRVRPATLLLGTSKVECGIDPASPALPRASGPVFNGGVPGTDIRHAYSVLRDAQRVAPLRHVLLVVEITELMAPPKADERKTPDPFLPGPHKRAKETLAALLSRDALQDSVTTLLAQHGVASGLDHDGLLADDFFTRGIAREGAAALFDQKLPTEIVALDHIAERVRRNPAGGTASLSWIREFIALSRAHGITLDIAIAPVHADLLRLIDRKGLSPRIAIAKRALTETVEREGQGRVALWDFLRFDRYSTEAQRAPGDTRPLAWFWEPNHFRRPLGEKMLQTIYHGGTDFGLRLTGATLDETLARDEEARRRDAADAREENARLDRQLAALTPRAG